MTPTQDGSPDLVLSDGASFLSDEERLFFTQRSTIYQDSVHPSDQVILSYAGVLPASGTSYCTLFARTIPASSPSGTNRYREYYVTAEGRLQLPWLPTHQLPMRIRDLHVDPRDSTTEWIPHFGPNVASFEATGPSVVEEGKRFIAVVQKMGVVGDAGAREPRVLPEGTGRSDWTEIVNVVYRVEQPAIDGPVSSDNGASRGCF